jgi:hypothetical protein
LASETSQIRDECVISYLLSLSFAFGPRGAMCEFDLWDTNAPWRSVAQHHFAISKEYAWFNMQCPGIEELVKSPGKMINHLDRLALVVQ